MKVIKKVGVIVGAVRKTVLRHPAKYVMLLCGVIIVLGAGAVTYSVVNNASSVSTDSSTGVPVPISSNTNNTAPQSTQVPTTPPNHSANTNSSRTSNTVKPYIVGVCTKTLIPYDTEYENTPSLPVGQTKIIYPGINGYTTSCTNNSDGTNDTHFFDPVPSAPRVVEVGTASQNPAPSNGVSYQEAQSSCSALLANGGGTASSAYSQCLHAYGY